MGFRHGRPVLVADFDFMGERARIDDLALTLHCASVGPELAAALQVMTDLERWRNALA